ncbi:MAG: NAD(P)-dependent oxidoreductase, partial [Pseudomonadota bacterium]
MSKAEIAAIGAVHPMVKEHLGDEFTLHEVYKEADMIAALEALGSSIRGVYSHGMAGLPTAVINALPKLEICSIFGVGLERVDQSLAKDRGVTVTIASVLYDDVADLAIGLAIDVCRCISLGDRHVRRGDWSTKGRIAAGHSFSKRRAGILGLGRIGNEVGRRLQAFKMEIGYYDPIPKEGVEFTRYESPVDLATNSDILFMCAAGNEKMMRFVNADILNAIGPDGCFINIGRGWLVDEPALLAALQEGRLG